MKILHTSDWHLGSSLHDRKRYEESGQFLDWLITCIREEEIDVILVAGDIFDTSTPSNRALGLYYQFLNQVATIPDLKVVITAGNHDSPSLLNAPKELLRQLRIHVIGSVTQDPADEVLVIEDKNQVPSLIVCAVPFLRDRDIRIAEPGESIDDKAEKVQDGIRDHYRQVWETAESHHLKSGISIPVIAMGHLCMIGCQSAGDDGVRELSIGNLAGINQERIRYGFDYIALGHLHKPQVVGGNPSCRYSGSPIPMGFGETGQVKEIVVIEILEGQEKQIRPIKIPSFRRLAQIRGDMASIEGEIRDLCRTGEKIWAEVVVETEFNTSSIQVRLRELVKNTTVEILKIGNKPLLDKALRRMEEGENLGDLDETEVFSRCLAANKIPDEDRPVYLDLFREILIAVREEDRNAE